MAKITIEAHLVDNLKAKLLIGTDVLRREGFSLDFEKAGARIASYHDTIFPIAMHAKPNHITSQPVYATKDTVVPPKSTVQVPIKVKGHLPRARDYLFAPVPTASFVDCHLVDADFSFVPVMNPSPHHHMFKRHERIGTLDKADYTMACAVTPDIASLAQLDNKDTAMPLRHVLGRRRSQRQSSRTASGSIATARKQGS